MTLTSLLARLRRRWLTMRLGSDVLAARAARPAPSNQPLSADAEPPHP